MKPREKQVDPYQTLKDWCDEADKLLESDRASMTELERDVLENCKEDLDLMYLYAGQNKPKYNEIKDDLVDVFIDCLDDIKHQGLLKFIEDLNNAMPTLDKRPKPANTEAQQASPRGVKNSAADIAGTPPDSPPHQRQRTEAAAATPQPPQRSRASAVSPGLFKSKEYLLQRVEDEANEALGIDSKGGKYTERELNAHQPRGTKKRW